MDAGSIQSMTAGLNYNNTFAIGVAAKALGQQQLEGQGALQLIQAANVPTRHSSHNGQVDLYA